MKWAPELGARDAPRDAAGAAVDAVVVLGCRLDDAGAPSAAAARRIGRGAAAYHASGRPLVVASGGRRWGRAVEAIAIADALVDLGVPRARIALELFSLSTVENARFSAEILRAAGAGRVGVVTCDWHAPRAVRSFAAFGVDAIGLPAPSPTTDPWTRARRLAHEACSELLDAHLREACRRAGVITKDPG